MKVVWYTHLDRAARTEAYYLGIRHQLTSYAFGTIDMIASGEQARSGYAAPGVAAPLSVDAAASRNIALAGEPRSYGDVDYNDPEYVHEGSDWFSYYSDGSIHGIFVDLHLSIMRRDDKWR